MTRLSSERILRLLSVVMVCLVLTPFPGPAAAAPPPGAGTWQIPLPHPVSAEALLPALAAAGITVREVRHSNDVTSGGYYPDSRMTPGENARQYDASILQDYGTRPMVNFVVVDVSASNRSVTARDIIDLVRRLPVFQAPPVAKGLPEARNAASQGRAPPEPPISVASETPVWAPSYTEMRIVTESGRAAMYHYYSWSADLPVHRPTYVPLDWGIEFELVQYELGRSGFRPFCASGNDLNFWAIHAGVSYSAYNQGFSTANLGIYFDSNITFDGCDHLSMAMGVGYPRVIANRNNFFALEFIVRSSRGQQSSSVISSSFQAVGNECTGAPNTDCMASTKTDLGPGPAQRRGWH